MTSLESADVMKQTVPGNVISCNCSPLSFIVAPVDSLVLNSP